MSYHDFLARPRTEGVEPPDGLAPPWLLRPKGATFLGALGDGMDFVAVSAKEAVKARMPELCPTDALPHIGEERGIERGLAEGYDSYRARLISAWDIWAYGGTPLGLLRALLASGFTAVIKAQSGIQCRLDSSGNLVTGTMSGTIHLGGSPELWSDIAIDVVQPFPWAWRYSPWNVPGDDSVYVAHMRALILAWKAAHSRVVRFRAVDGALWDEPSWNHFNWGEGTVVAWTPPAG